MDSINPNPPSSSNTKQSLQLPADILDEILSKLAVKSLLQFRCASKSWRCLIDSKLFIKNLLEYSTRDSSFPYHRIVLGNQLKQYSLHSLLNGSINPSPLAGPESFGPGSVQIIGCCNGLVCVAERSQQRFFMWNPATRISHKLPEIIENADLSGPIICCGFGWDESSNAYKVFVIMNTKEIDKKNITKVYSSKTNSWKALEPYNFKTKSRDSFYTHRQGKFVGGKLNWTRSSSGGNSGSRIHDIVTFELKSEVFGEMEQPRASFEAWLGVLGGRLSVVYNSKRCLDVWVMKEYGVTESWTKAMGVPLVDVPPCLNLSVPYVAPLLIGRNGEILLIYGPYFIVYHPQEDVRLQVKKIDGAIVSPVYVESLVSPLF